MAQRSRPKLGPPAAKLADRGFRALLRLDERLINGHESPTNGVIDPSRLPWAASLEARRHVIRAELDALIASGVELPETDELVGQSQGAEGRWTTYVLGWYGQWLEQSCSRCPQTAALLRTIPGLQIAGFTVLDAHTHIPRHQGPAKSLRYQLGVRIPEPVGACRLQVGDDVAVWRDGHSLAFDDRSFHEAWNDSDDSRYVLFVQVQWPIGGLAGVVHRCAHRAFALATRSIPERAAALDVARNGVR